MYVVRYTCLTTDQIIYSDFFFFFIVLWASLLGLNKPYSRPVC